MNLKNRDSKSKSNITRSKSKNSAKSELSECEKCTAWTEEKTFTH
jgi:ribosomal protein L32